MLDRPQRSLVDPANLTSALVLSADPPMVANHQLVDF
jgi:hypothetical protein